MGNQSSWLDEWKIRHINLGEMEVWGVSQVEILKVNSTSKPEILIRLGYSAIYSPTTQEVVAKYVHSVFYGISNTSFGISIENTIININWERY